MNARMSPRLPCRQLERLRQRSPALALLLAAVLEPPACSDGAGPGDDGPPGSPEGIEARLAELSEGPVAVRLDEGGRLRTLQARIPTTGSDAAARAQGFVAAQADLFGVTDPATELPVSEIRTGLLPGSLVVLERRASGLPIFGAEVRVHLEPSGHVLYVSTVLPREVSVETTTPEIDAAAARSAAIAELGLDAERAVAGEPELMLLDTGLLVGDSGPTYLVWSFALDDGLPDGDTHVFVDAVTAAVRFAHPLSDEALHRRTYNAGRQSDRNALVVERDQRVWFDDSGQQAAEASPDGTSAHALAEVLWRYYMDTFDYDSFDDLAGTIESWVHFRHLNRNGVERDNASWHRGLRSFWFNDGMVTLDVFGHEFAHAVAHASADLLNVAEPGALNESLGDVFSSFTDPDAPWTVGEGSRRGLLRNLADPTQHGHPRHRNAQRPIAEAGTCDARSATCPAGHYCVGRQCLALSRENDAGWVHFNNGIPNHAAYLMIQGGTHADSQIPVQGIGPRRAEQIYFTALTMVFGRLTRFRDARDHLLFTCRALIDYTVPSGEVIEASHCGSVINGFAAVGIGTRDTDNDSWDDDEDNCKDDPNPRQEDADDDDVGDACEEGAAPGVFPSQPPSVPTCAPVFPGIRPGSFGTGTPEDWPLVEQTAVEAVELDFTENYYDFVVVCHYDPQHDPVDSSYTFQANLRWQPYDPARYGAPLPFTYTVGCESDGDALTGDIGPFRSSSHFAYINLSLSYPDEAIWYSRQAEYLATMLTELEGHAHVCP